LGEDWSKLKMTMNWLFTLRGMPQLYYGTEVLMKNYKVNTDATVREDFPGGWSEDPLRTNRFLKEGRTGLQDSAFTYISCLANFRKSSTALTTGRLMQFIPRDGLYLYFRYDSKQTVLVITHTGKQPIKPDWSVYKERVDGYGRVRNIVTGQLSRLADFSIKPGESFVLELLQ